jgi:endo-1,4-beta-D-glucanase Y
MIEEGGCMLKKVLMISFVVCAWIGSAYSAPNFPFPQQAKYANGILPAGVDYKEVQKVYDVWLPNYYEESGDQARIKFDSSYQTVSEGIGYGMIIMVYMDNATNNTKPKFDKLWKYYQNHSSGNPALMDWKIHGFSGVDGSGSATDADLDAAVGLLMAEKQWGGYATAASSLISAIASRDVSGDNFKGGSNWTAYNPSYMSTVATQLFANLGGGSWSTVQSNCYTLLGKAQNGTTGMWPNWCSISGSPGGGTGDYQEIYGFDACRTPWRLGWAYVWYGHAQAKTLCSKVVSWFKTKTSDEPGTIGQKYNLDGTINTSAGGNSDNIPTYLGPLTIGGMVDATFQTWVNKGYTKLRSFGGKNNNYYNECLDILSMLLLTGNMPDLTKATPKASATLTVNVDPPAAGTVTITPKKDSYAINDPVTITTATSNSARYTFLGWQGDYVGTQASADIKVFCDMVVTAVYKDNQATDMVDDCEDGDNQTFLKSFWFSYNDVKDTGKSTITPLLTDSTHVVPDVMTAGGSNSSTKAMKVTYKLDKGKFKYQPYVGVGFALNPDRKSIDVSSSTGFRFSYKGTFGSKDTCCLKLECDAITEAGADYSYTLAPSTSWKEVQVLWADFLQPQWATKPTALDKTRVPKIQWQIQGNTGSSGELWLDDIHLIGYNIPRQTGIKSGPNALSADRMLGRLSCQQSGKNLVVNYTIKKNSHIKLGLFDINGRLVINLSQQFQIAGSHAMKINLHDRKFADSGYLVSLSTSEGTFSRPIIVNR